MAEQTPDPSTLEWLADFIEQQESIGDLTEDELTPEQREWWDTNVRGAHGMFPKVVDEPWAWLRERARRVRGAADRGDNIFCANRRCRFGFVHLGPCLEPSLAEEADRG